jgi:hypothetical protein
MERAAIAVVLTRGGFETVPFFELPVRSAINVAINVEEAAQDGVAGAYRLCWQRVTITQYLIGTSLVLTRLPIEREMQRGTTKLLLVQAPNDPRQGYP